MKSSGVFGLVRSKLLEREEDSRASVGIFFCSIRSFAIWSSIEILILLLLPVTAVEKYTLVSHKYFSVSNNSSSLWIHSPGTGEMAVTASSNLEIAL